ncbi:hypothetical protein HDV05_008004 [Chytridiales sp. JEL 0842]|nr:hypothetical protein HDV05_008004 [Chytridiales sp. JEL 0842]
MMLITPRRALTIAGSDSGGGAGIQADLKTMTSLGVFGTSALTAITAQNTVGVQGVSPVDPAFVSQQIESVLSDIGTDAVKIGMLFDEGIINAVCDTLEKHSNSINNGPTTAAAAANQLKIVVDPVMVATQSRRPLLSPTAVDTLKSRLLPMSLIVTPNVPEAEVISGKTIDSLQDMKTVATLIHALGPQYVLLKGGHLPLTENGSPASLSSSPSSEEPVVVVDLLYDGKEFTEFRNPYVKTENTHGTGCTLSAAITSYLAKKESVHQAVKQGIEYVHHALHHSFRIGKGHGPLNHFHPFITTLSPKGGFVEFLKESCASEWHAYVNHPFVQGMADGTLPVESFKYYIKQDYIFLNHYARAYALASFKEHEFKNITRAAEIVKVIGEEAEMHVNYCASWNISRQALESTPESSANLAYTRYVLEKGLSGDRLDLRVALAPCLLGYGEIGARLAADPNTKREGNPYWPWIQNYNKDSFRAAVKEGEELLESLAHEIVHVTNTERLNKLAEIFRQATMLEKNFWEMGFHQLP